jgi:mevalonate kinase
VILVPAGISGVACGKTILVGEHAVVHGYPAIALPLRAQSLSVTFGDVLERGVGASAARDAWRNVWTLSMSGRLVQLPESERDRLTHSLELGLSLVAGEAGGKLSLDEFLPQRIEIESHLPLGAGMGGSAALSAALLRALAQAFKKNWSEQELAHHANTLDGFFHGRASGLDAATVVSNGIIKFRKDSGIQSLQNARSFWIFLVDTRERTPTRDMVERVGQLRSERKEFVDEQFVRLGECAARVEDCLTTGQLLELGEWLNAAHGALRNLRVSTEKLDSCVSALRQAGALGAKLTGGGGGGLALGVFASRPSASVTEVFAPFPHYLTFVPGDENS